MSFADSIVDFSELTGVYFRNVLPDEVEKSEETVQIYPRTDPRLAGLLNSAPCRVVNRPAATYSNRSKPYQALIIRQFGFAIPKTLISNDPDAARHFYDECAWKLIRKSMSGVRSIVRRVNKEDLGNADLWADSAIQLQEYLPGDNIRVHVIGERVFAVRIQCEAVDYRYAGAEGHARTMVPETLPEDVATNCIRLTKELGLAMSGIDLKETPTGERYCFEVNTSPAFPFYESLARPVIADALAEFLTEKSA
jgi:glutathione synthase/RimK-type ligase-like ATP-grasp enzyme